MAIVGMNRCGRPLVAMGAAVLVCSGTALATPAPPAPRSVVRATYVVGMDGPYVGDAGSEFDGMRPVSPVRHSSPETGEADMSPSLKALQGDFWVQARIVFTVTVDDRVTGCTLAGARMLVGKGTLDEADVSAAACRLATTRMNFRHALDRDGRPVAAQFGQSAWFRRFTGTSPSLWQRATPPPAPPPPVSPVAARTSGLSPAWPPLYAPLISFRPSEPDWSGALRRFRPHASVLPAGVFIDVETTGEVSRCNFGASSGDAAFDAAICKSLLASRQPYSGLTKVHDYPLLVNWDGKEAHMVLPGRALGPSFSNYGSALPTRPGATGRVTMQAQVDKTGAVSQCRIVSGSGDDALDVESCRVLSSQTQMKPGTDIFGQPARGTIRVLANWSDGVWGVPVW